MKKIISIIIIFTILFNIIYYIYIPTESLSALSATYTQSLKVGIDSFPESYKPYLQKLQEMHPNWTFKAYYTGIDWTEVTSSSAENACLKNTIKKVDLMDPTMLCICGRTGDAGYYCASAKTVNYYLDPRNSLTEYSIYQFLDLSNSVQISRDIIQGVVSDTYLSKYTDTIIEAASRTEISPMHIIVTIFQELGKTKDTPKAIFGKVPGYENLYNFYNYGANDGDGAVERGLEKAREMNWTNPEIALIDGAEKVLKNGYISQGQTTKYFYKFDVVGNEILKDNEEKVYSSSNFFNHQYMTNIQDPSSQAGMLMEYYTNYGLANSNLVFTIPVYNNMPGVPVGFPTTLTEADGELYYVNTVHVSSLNVSDASGNIVGKLTKGQIVAVQSIENNRATLKIKVATSRGTDENGKAKWNYEDRIVILNDASYLVKCETTSNVIPPVNTLDFKIEGNNLKMTPSVTVSNIKETYPNAIIQKADGTDISEAAESIGTGYKIIIDGTEYTAIKYGDINGDGLINTGDTYLIKLTIVGNRNLDGIYYISADVNKDGAINTGDSYLLKREVMDIKSIGL
ncbi:MAG: dockerin type I domain-containing protein [Candidatus Scatovivens sp.]